MLRLLSIACGGALGSVLRYLLGVLTQRQWDMRVPSFYFPVGTLLINVVGCLLIGLLSAIFAANPTIRDEVRYGLIVGVLGGFTTFSAFGLETFVLATDERPLAALAYVLASCALGIAAVFLGYRLGQGLFGA
jgi:CrcB protein